MTSNLFFSGVFAAPVCPMTPSQDVDYDDYAQYAAWVARVRGVAGLVVNVNAGEGHALSVKERLEIVRRVKVAVPAHVKVVGGISGESTREVVEHAVALKEIGADGGIVYAVRDWIFGRGPGVVPKLFAAINDATDLPLIIFNSRSCAYDVPTLLDLTTIPSVKGIKQATTDIADYEISYYALKEKRPDVAIMAAYDAHLFPTMAVGFDGVLLGIAAVVPELIVDMCNAMARGDYETGRALSRQLWPLVEATYGTKPIALRHVRTKAVLHAMGRIANATVREPMLPLSDGEQTALFSALAPTGLVPEVGAAK